MIEMFFKVLLLMMVIVIVVFGVVQVGVMEDLVVVVKKEGMLIMIVFLYDWCNYGGVIEGFKKKYGIVINELNLDVGLGDEIEVIKVNKGNIGLQVFDVIDVGFFFGLQVKKDGLIQFYKVFIWGEILDNVKDVEGYWYGDYYGVMLLFVNKDFVKNILKDWVDLQKLEYVNMVVFVGDLCQVNQVIFGVFVVGFFVLNGDVVKVGDVGFEFFKGLNVVGNFVLVIGKVVLFV